MITLAGVFEALGALIDGKPMKKKKFLTPPVEDMTSGEVHRYVEAKAEEASKRFREAAMEKMKSGMDGAVISGTSPYEGKYGWVQYAEEVVTTAATTPGSYVGTVPGSSLTGFGGVTLRAATTAIPMTPWAAPITVTPTSKKYGAFEIDEVIRIFAHSWRQGANEDRCSQEALDLYLDNHLIHVAKLKVAGFTGPTGVVDFVHEALEDHFPDKPRAEPVYLDPEDRPWYEHLRRR